MKEIADDVDGLLALAFVDLAAADKPDVISGDPEIAQTFAAQFADAATNILTTDVYENPEWVHLSLSDHQVLFGPADTKNTVVLMVCRSKNPGLARHAFLRLLTTTERVAA